MTELIGPQVMGKDPLLEENMDKKIAGLLGAAAALTTVTAAHATTAQSTVPGAAPSYGSLLDPIPNASALLKSDDALRAQTGSTRISQVSVGVGVAHHHHHHHHHGVVVRLGHGHHHYHHHHHSVVVHHD